MHSVEISFLNSDCLLTSSVIQNACIWWPHWYQNRWPPTVYDRWPAIFSVGFFGLSAFFTREAYCIVRPCYGFLSVHRSLVKCVLGVARSLCGIWASCYIMKLCSRLFVLYCRNCPKDDKFRYFIAILTKLGAA